MKYSEIPVRSAYEQIGVETMPSFKEIVNSKGKAFGVPTRHASKLQKLKVLREDIMKAGNAAKKILSYPVIAKENDWIVYDLWKVPFEVPRVLALPLNKEERQISGLFWGGIVAFGLTVYGMGYISKAAPKVGPYLELPALAIYLLSSGAVFCGICSDVDYVLKKIVSKYNGGNIE